MAPGDPSREDKDRLLQPSKACCQQPIALAATCRKYGPPAVILLLQARPQCRHSAKSAILHKTRQRGTAATSMCTCTHSGVYLGIDHMKNVHTKFSTYTKFSILVRDSVIHCVSNHGLEMNNPPGEARWIVHLETMITDTMNT